MTDPIAEFQAACRSIDGEPRPDRILMHEEMYAEVKARIDHWERWAVKILRRRSLLSSRYDQRRRQRAQGVAGIREAQRIMALDWQREEP